MLSLYQRSRLAENPCILRIDLDGANLQFCSIISAPLSSVIAVNSFHQMVIKETRCVYSRWILDEEVTDRSSLGEELNEYCAQYTIYHVTEKREQVTAEQTGET